MYQGWLWYVKGLLRYGLTSGLAASPPNLIGSSGQTVLNLKGPSYVLHQASPDDHVCQVSRWLDKICDRSSTLKVFDINQDGGHIRHGAMTSWGVLNWAWFKESNDTWYVKIGRIGRKLWTWMHAQLWPVGGAGAVGLATWDWPNGLMGLSWTSVPNFTTFRQAVLWAAIDSNGSIIIIIRRRRIRKKTIGCLAT